MKRCPGCNTVYPSSEATCHACGFTCETIDNFPAYAPDAAHEGSGFKSSSFHQLAAREAGNFWFRARNRLIVWTLGQYCEGLDGGSFLEIGCGTGYVLSGIAKAYPHAQLHGSELFTQGLTFAASRLPSVNLMQMDARQIPFEEEFNCIGAFDVLEHIEEDRQVLHQIHRALKQRGMVILTVPQHRWLWSPVDRYACHVRRYSANELQTKLQETGFEMLRSTSFVTGLLPFMLVSRFFQRFSTVDTGKPNDGLSIASWLNFLFEKMLNAEVRLIRWGINFPFGGSRLIVARKMEK